MSHKDQLRSQRINTVINEKSKREDKQCEKITAMVIEDLQEEFGVKLEWEKRIYLVDIIQQLRKSYPDVEFASPIETSFMTPDGGITYIIDKNGKKYPLLIGEVKNQGTNDARAQEGLKKQAQGNAVERLGKNVIGFRTLMLNEGIFPFVCFGDGCDFDDGSSILDRIITIAMFGELNKDHTANEGVGGVFNRGSYYFRAPYWTGEEMYDILYEVGKKAIYYYFAKYGDQSFMFKKGEIKPKRTDADDAVKNEKIKQPSLFGDDDVVHCPICGAKMELRKSKFGRKFYGCSNYPHCKGYLPFNKKMRK